MAWFISALGGVFAYGQTVSYTLSDGTSVETASAIIEPVVIEEEAAGIADALADADDLGDLGGLAGGDLGGDDSLGDLDALLDGDLNQLASTDVRVPVFGEEVTTVSRQESTVGRSAAAVYVITNEMIRRSGVRTIPDALRLAPGVQVANIDSNKWAISIRGFNGRFSNKLLVQIDGRSVYTPLFAGVFWELQDVLLEDIERIEIIRGPGATVWGANAVNGVINVITKSSHDTHGAFAEGGAGNERGFASARLGGKLGKASWRAYGKWFERDGGFHPAGSGDDWRVGRLGFRTDWNPNCEDTVTVQGNYYDGNAGHTQFTPIPTPPYLTVGPEDQQLGGGYGLLRWTRAYSDDSDWSVQVYYDRTQRTLDSIGWREDRDTVDVDFQRRFKFRRWHSIICGAGYRNSADRIRNSFSLSLIPEKRADDLFSTFIQDEMTLLEDLLYFTAGSKFSWNDYTGFEYQPTARLLYTPSNRQSIWAAVSRAIRMPSRASDDVRLITAPVSTPIFPTFPTVTGNRELQSEQLLAWEFGMRAAPNDDFYWDFAAFYNQYEDIQEIVPGFPGFDPVSGVFALPMNFVNSGRADSYGFELATTLNMLDNWTVRGAYSFLRINSTQANVETENPRNQFFVHSSWDLGHSCNFDLFGRYVDSLFSLNIPSYFEMDARLAWNPTERLELSVVGRNLLDNAHPEFGDDVQVGTFATEVEREFYGMFAWRY